MGIITSFKKRWVIEEVVVEEELKDLLCRGNKLNVYLVVDPTAKDLHIGHLAGLRLLKQFQRKGHNAIFLIGDYTARIGDPKDKISARKTFTEAEINANMVTYISQVKKIFEFPNHLDIIQIEDIVDINKKFSKEVILRFKKELNRDKSGILKFILENIKNIKGVDNETSHMANMIMGLGILYKRWGL